VYIPVVMKQTLVRVFVVIGIVWLGSLPPAFTQVKPAEPKLTFAFEVRATVGAPLEVGTLGHCADLQWPRGGAA
jgi:hypothetical protein